MTGECSEPDLPGWWRRNRALKRRLDLPAYEPPRFSDGVYVHEVVAEVEGDMGCSIRLVGFDTRVGDDWLVMVDGVEVAGIGKSRDGNGNTVYEVSANRFRDLVVSAVAD